MYRTGREGDKRTMNEREEWRRDMKENVSKDWLWADGPGRSGALGAVCRPRFITGSTETTGSETALTTSHKAF